MQEHICYGPLISNRIGGRAERSTRRSDAIQRYHIIVCSFKNAVAGNYIEDLHGLLDYCTSIADYPNNC